MRARWNDGVQLAAIALLAVLASAAGAGAQDAAQDVAQEANGRHAEGSGGEWDARMRAVWAQRVAGARQPLADCQRAARAEEPFEPRVLIEVRVGPNGRVVRARVEQSNPSDRRFERCIAGVVRGWRLSAHSDRRPRVRIFDLRFDTDGPVVGASAATGLFGAIVGGEAISGLYAPLGNEADAAYGMGGLGLRGTGQGGGGTGEGTIGLGRVGTIGVGSGRGAGRAASSVGRTTFGRPDVRGSLSVDVIQRMVRRNHAVVRYCYERELQREPRLSGELTLRFVIDSDGGVASAEVRETTLATASVGGCILRVIRRTRFPRPAGGGIVVVQYPFQFQAVIDEPRDQDPPAP